ncbi:MAG: alpha/beta hydrolase [Gammaproteobacteria bacterium]|nr:alpha/beta hydrolase [Gammaproteobacteria bacterium]
MIRRVLILAISLIASACAPYGHSVIAERRGLQRSEVTGDVFRHLVYQRFDPSGSARLHVYIEGDGIPWVGNLPGADPTPRNALALRLAAVDPQDIAYVGRPCYFQVQTPDKCTANYWTSDRYGEEVIRSMASVVEQVRGPRHRELVLIGHSGGGAIAALLESRVDGVVAVVTIAANLDIERWAAHHDYDPLDGSLNPVDEPTDPRIPKYQLVGRADDNVPLQTVVHYADDRQNVELLVYDGFNHACCWEKEWASFLSRLDRALATTEPF